MSSSRHTKPSYTVPLVALVVVVAAWYVFNPNPAGQVSKGCPAAYVQGLAPVGSTVYEWIQTGNYTTPIPQEAFTIGAPEPGSNFGRFTTKAPIEPGQSAIFSTTFSSSSAQFIGAPTGNFISIYYVPNSICYHYLILSTPVP